MTSVFRGGNVGRDAIGNGSGTKGKGSVYGSARGGKRRNAREAVKYASDLDLEETHCRGGSERERLIGPAQRPRKRKNKRYRVPNAEY